MRFMQVQIGLRLGYSYGLILVLMMSLVLLGLSRLALLERNIESILNDNLVQIKAVGEMRQAVMIIAVTTRDMALASSEQQIAAGVQQLEQARKSYSESAKRLAALVTSDTAKTLLDRVSALEAGTRPLIEKAVMLARENRLDEVIPVLVNEVQPNQKKWLSAMEEMIAVQEQIANQSKAEALEVYNNARLLMSAIAAFALLFAGVTAWRITRSITVPLGQAVGLAQRVARGDLTSVVQVERVDETGQLMAALKTMNENLKSIVGNLQEGTDTITTASQRIATGNADLASRTEDQSASLSRTTALMKNLTSTVTKNADNAHNANQVVLSACKVAGQGGQVMGEVIDTMKSISESAGRIVDIISVIDGIAFQTNILALNAAVEAARAGEQGRGFAVVATEVRALAQRSASAAKEIKNLIADSVDKVGQGGKLVEKAGVTINDVIASVKSVSDIVNEVTTASREQLAGIEQVNQALLHMGEITRQNAGQAEDAATAAQSLQNEAVGLTRIANSFTLQDKPRPAVAARLALAGA